MMVRVQLYDNAADDSDNRNGEENSLVTNCSNTWLFLQVGQTTFLA